MRIRTERARRYVADALHAFERAPVEVAISLLLAAAFSYSVANDIEPVDAWLELAIVGVLGAGAAFAATLLNALGEWSTRTRWLVTGAGVLAAVGYGIFVLDLDRAAEAWRAAALVAGALLLLLAAPAYGAGADATARFRRVTGRIVIRTLATGVYAIALYAGLALALGAVNTLFELNLSERVYIHVFGWIFLVLVPWTIVGGVPDYVSPATEPGAVAAAVHRLSAFLVTPLLAIYYVILYAYAIRIVITGELPKNIVSPLVIAAGLIAALALVLFDRDPGGEPGIQPLRLAVPLFLPLALLGLFALNLRLGQYGWTEFRALRTVLLSALGLSAAAALPAVVRRRRLPHQLVPITLAAALIVAVAGPWNVLAASRRSQQARLNEALAGLGIANGGAVARDTVIANAVFDDISSTSRYLATHFGADALPPVMAVHARQDVHTDLAHAIGLRRAELPSLDVRGLFVQLEDGATFVEEDGTRVTYLRLESFRTPGEPRSAYARADSLRVAFTTDGTELTADLTPVYEAVRSGGARQALQPELSRVNVTDAAGAVRGELTVLEIGFGGQSAPRLLRLVGLLRTAPVAAR